MTFASERRAFEKDVLKVLSPRLKGSRWRKNQNAIFCEVNGYYFDVLINVYLNDSKIVVCMSSKPMSLDQLYWKITDLNENNSQPLSFRTWGAFTCSGLPLTEKSIEDEGVSAATLVEEIFKWAESQLESVVPRLECEDFSSAVAMHPNQVERGAYAITYVTSLIHEGNLNTARQAAAAYADGSSKSTSSHTHVGRDFHEIAVEWIDSTIGAG